MELATNLKSQGIFIGDKNQVAVLSTKKWSDIYNYLKVIPRKATVKRTTKETNITVSINLDGEGISKLDTGIGFFDHMLEQLAKHGNLNLEVIVKGDLEIDNHHTIEDVGISLGDAFLKALGNFFILLKVLIAQSHSNYIYTSLHCPCGALRLVYHFFLCENFN